MAEQSVTWQVRRRSDDKVPRREKLCGWQIVERGAAVMSAEGLWHALPVAEGCWERNLLVRAARKRLYEAAVVSH